MPKIAFSLLKESFPASNTENDTPLMLLIYCTESRRLSFKLFQIGTFAEQRLEMPHYETETRSTAAPCRLALDSAGQYSKKEVIKPVVPSFLTHCDSPTPNKKKPNKNNQDKQRAKAPATANEVLSWRRDSYRSNSESSDSSIHYRASDFKPDTDKLRKNKRKSDKGKVDSNPNQKQNKSDMTDTPDRRQFQIRTLNKFDVIADASEADDLGPNDSDVAPVTQPENNNNPWFEKFEVKQPPSQVVRRKRGANES